MTCTDKCCRGSLPAETPKPQPAYRWTAAKWAMEALCLGVIFLLAIWS